MSRVNDSSDMEVDSDASPVAGTSGCQRPKSTVGMSCGRELPRSPADIAKRRASEFSSSISESPAKKQGLDNANKICKLETRMLLVSTPKESQAANA